MNYFLRHDQLDDLLMYLKNKGYRCLGPQVKYGTIIFDELDSAGQLPWGIRDVQAPGSYQLEETNRNEAFAWANGPQAIKPLLFKPRETLWRVERDNNGQLTFNEADASIQPVALIGARSCDLAGMAVQDKVFVSDAYQDKRYQQQRENLLIIAVNCGYSGGNCFCVSTNTGPKAESGFDLALTEVNNGFVVDVGSDQGRVLIDALECANVNDDLQTQAEKNIQRAAAMQTKKMPKNNSRELRDLLMNNLDHERWDDVASRCLSCGNCTSVCPTCFCHHETETASLDGKTSQHDREWDSCFSAGHSYVHNKVIRDDTKTQYKQWLTHKVATWWDQFDTSGCIGCGRCITWCPVGIDLVEEIKAIEESED